MSEILRPKRRFKSGTAAAAELTLPEVLLPATGDGSRGFRLRRSGRPHEGFRPLQSEVPIRAAELSGWSFSGLVDEAVVRLQQLRHSQ